MGSRYGGLKQLDGLGPNGETNHGLLGVRRYPAPASAK